MTRRFLVNLNLKTTYTKAEIIRAGGRGISPLLHEVIPVNLSDILPPKSIPKTWPKKEDASLLPMKERLALAKGLCKREGWGYFCDRLKSGGYSLKVFQLYCFKKGTSSSSRLVKRVRTCLAFLGDLHVTRRPNRYRSDYSREVVRYYFKERSEAPPAWRKPR